MHFERLQTQQGNLYLKAMELYGASFPLHEQREASSQAKIMEHGEYQCNLICEENELVGILLCWETEEFIYVEHFCIDPEMRNQKYGQRALELLNRRKKPVILEIDPPEDEVSARRKGFYERAGYAANGFEHLHPPYRAGRGGHRLAVMSHPRRLTQAEYDAFDRYLKETVMGS